MFSTRNIVKCILCDMDGVLRIGSQSIEGIQNIFSYFTELKIQPIIITNECRYTNEKIYDDLERMCILDKKDKVPLITSANVTKTWLQNYIYENKNHNYTYNICVIGEKGLKTNIESIYSYSELKSNNSIKLSSKWDSRDNVKNILIIGCLFNYTENQKNIVKEWIQHNQTLVVKTCDDHSDPEDNCTLPNTILKSFNREADVTTGKPDVNFSREINLILKQNNLSQIQKNEIMLVGDTMNTDIKMGKLLNYQTVLVLSGNTKKCDIPNYVYRPEYVLSSIKDIHQLLE